MHTVFSHIIQKRFSWANENVATEALAYILESSDSARRWLTKLLRGIIPDLPPLRFKTQQTDGAMRPDMWGFVDTEPRVFVENKFWAGLTNNQPIAYLRRLATCSQPTILLVVAPAEREQTLWRELIRRLGDAGISVAACESAAGVSLTGVTQLRPILALASWTKVLSILEHETVDDQNARRDLVQLRSLCDAADMDAFASVTREQLSDHRAAAFIVHLGAIVQAVVDLAVTEDVLCIKGLRPQASWEWIGRYARVGGYQGAGAWIGIHFGLWRTFGTSPLWLTFSYTRYGRGHEVRQIIEPWSAHNGEFAVAANGEFAIALDVPTGEEKESVVRALVNQIRPIARVLDALPPRTMASVEPESDEVSAQPEELR